MKKPTVKFVFVVGLLCLTVISANLWEVEKVAAGKKVGLENIPTQIGEWKMTNAQTSRGLIKKWEFMNEVVMRTYTNPKGQNIWLVIVYGSDQRQNFSIHLPEGCYRGAGFDIETVGKAAVFDNGVQLKRLVARRQGQTEPISYWIMLDGKVMSNHLERKFTQFYYTVFKKPAYGALVRISAPVTEGHVDAAYAAQTDFIQAMAQSFPVELRDVIFGNMLAGVKL